MITVQELKALKLFMAKRGRPTHGVLLADSQDGFITAYASDGLQLLAIRTAHENKQLPLFIPGELVTTITATQCSPHTVVHVGDQEISWDRYSTYYLSGYKSQDVLVRNAFERIASQRGLSTQVELAAKQLEKFCQAAKILEDSPLVLEPVGDFTLVRFANYDRATGIGLNVTSDYCTSVSLDGFAPICSSKTEPKPLPDCPE